MDVQLTYTGARPVDVLLCVDPEGLARLRPTLRSLCVGLVDHPVRLRLLSSTPDVEALTLGPVQAIVHPRLVWPVARWRMAHIAENLIEEPPDVVHAVSAGSYRLASFLAQRCGAELMLDVSSTEDARAASRLPDAAHAFLIAFSRPLEEELENRWRIPADRVILVRPGVTASRQTACFDDPEQTPTLLCVAVMRRESRVDLLLRALVLLQTRGVPFAAFLVGEGPSESVLRQFVRRERLDDAVTFVQITSGAGEVMQSADIFVVPGVSSQVSIRTLQAMAAGALVVAMPDDVNDFLRADETAMLCPSATPQALADVLQRAIEDREASRRLAQAGQAYVSTHHTVSQMAEQTAAAYAKLFAATTT